MSDNTNNGFPVPQEPLTRVEEYLSAIAGVTEATEIPEKPLTRIEAYLDKIVENGGGGGSSFEPTDAQLDAMNSGATTEKINQIETNKNNISTINNNLIYSPTEPTGDIADGAIWINTAVTAVSDYIKKYHVNKQLFDKDTVSIENAYIQGGDGAYAQSMNTKTAFMPCEPNTTYTVSKTLSARFAIGCFDTKPEFGDYATVYASDTAATSLTITTSDNARYIGIFYYYSTADTKTAQEILDTIMVNTGSKALPYEPYDDSGVVWHSNT